MKLLSFHFLSAFVAAEAWTQAEVTDNECLLGQGAEVIEEPCTDLYYGICQTIKVKGNSSCNVDILGDAEVTFYTSAIEVQYWPMISVPHGQEYHNEDVEEEEEDDTDPYGNEYGNEYGAYGNEYGNEYGSEWGAWLMAKPKLRQGNSDSQQIAGFLDDTTTQMANDVANQVAAFIEQMQN